MLGFDEFAMIVLTGEARGALCIELAYSGVAEQAPAILIQHRGFSEENSSF